jgi:phospholipase A1
MRRSEPPKVSAMRRIAPVLLGLVLPLHVAGAGNILSATEPRTSAGASLELVLTMTNDQAESVPVELPSQMHLRLETPTATGVLEFTPEPVGSITIPAGGFASVRLRGVLPVTVQGTAILTPTGMATNPVAIEVAQTAAVAASNAQAAARTAAPEGRLIDKPPPLAVSTYEPVYFLIGGAGGLNAKFQISFRYQLFDGRGKLASRMPWIDDLYLSYSQTSLWDLNDLSKPFTDSSYRPRLFFANYDLGRALDGLLRFGVESGFGHESNGKDGDESRSFNMLYVRPTVTVGDPDGLRFYAAPLIHNYIAEDENPDIADYRGYVDWLIGFGSKGGLDFWATLRKGTRSSYGSAELNLSYPLSKLSGGDLTGWLMLQYFGGYGESLLSYRDKLDSQLRLGIAVAL